MDFLSEFLKDHHPCYVCLKPASKACGHCHRPYCSRHCQRLDWTEYGHARQCHQRPDSSAWNNLFYRGLTGQLDESTVAAGDTLRRAVTQGWLQALQEDMPAPYGEPLRAVFERECVDKLDWLDKAIGPTLANQKLEQILCEYVRIMENWELRSEMALGMDAIRAYTDRNQRRTLQHLFDTEGKDSPVAKGLLLLWRRQSQRRAYEKCYNATFGEEEEEEEDTRPPSTVTVEEISAAHLGLGGADDLEAQDLKKILAKRRKKPPPPDKLVPIFESKRWLRAFVNLLAAGMWSSGVNPLARTFEWFAQIVLSTAQWGLHGPLKMLIQYDYAQKLLTALWNFKDNRPGELLTGFAMDAEKTEAIHEVMTKFRIAYLEYEDLDNSETRRARRDAALTLFANLSSPVIIPRLAEFGAAFTPYDSVALFMDVFTGLASAGLLGTSAVTVGNLINNPLKYATEAAVEALETYETRRAVEQEVILERVIHGNETDAPRPIMEEEEEESVFLPSPPNNNNNNNNNKVLPVHVHTPPEEKRPAAAGPTVTRTVNADPENLYNKQWRSFIPQEVKDKFVWIYDKLDDSITSNHPGAEPLAVMREAAWQLDYAGDGSFTGITVDYKTPSGERRFHAAISGAPAEWMEQWNGATAISPHMQLMFQLLAGDNETMRVIDTNTSQVDMSLATFVQAMRNMHEQLLPNFSKLWRGTPSPSMAEQIKTTVNTAPNKVLVNLSAEGAEGRPTRPTRVTPATHEKPSEANLEALDLMVAGQNRMFQQDKQDAETPEAIAGTAKSFLDWSGGLLEPLKRLDTGTSKPVPPPPAANDEKQQPSPPSPPPPKDNKGKGREKEEKQPSASSSPAPPPPPQTDKDETLPSPQPPPPPTPISFLATLRTVVVRLQKGFLPELFQLMLDRRRATSVIMLAADALPLAATVGSVLAAYGGVTATLSTPQHAWILTKAVLHLFVMRTFHQSMVRFYVLLLDPLIDTRHDLFRRKTRRVINLEYQRGGMSILEMAMAMRPGSTGELAAAIVRRPFLLLEKRTGVSATTRGISLLSVSVMGAVLGREVATWVPPTVADTMLKARDYNREWLAAKEGGPFRMLKTVKGRILMYAAGTVGIIAVAWIWPNQTDNAWKSLTAILVPESVVKAAQNALVPVAQSWWEIFKNKVSAVVPPIVGGATGVALVSGGATVAAWAPTLAYFPATILGLSMGTVGLVLTALTAGYTAVGVAVPERLPEFVQTTGNVLGNVTSIGLSSYVTMDKSLASIATSMEYLRGFSGPTLLTGFATVSILTMFLRPIIEGLAAGAGARARRGIENANLRSIVDQVIMLFSQFWEGNGDMIYLMIILQLSVSMVISHMDELAAAAVATANATLSSTLQQQQELFQHLLKHHQRTLASAAAAHVK